MTLPITLTATLRINDYDNQQYTIERKNPSPNKETGFDVWVPVDYVRSVKHLATIARRRVADHYAGEARKKAEEIFDQKGLGELISSLPLKGTSK